MSEVFQHYPALPASANPRFLRVGTPVIVQEYNVPITPGVQLRRWQPYRQPIVGTFDRQPRIEAATYDGQPAFTVRNLANMAMTFPDGTVQFVPHEGRPMLHCFQLCVRPKVILRKT